jgi:hypothetical protein
MGYAEDRRKAVEEAESVGITAVTEEDSYFTGESPSRKDAERFLYTVAERDVMLGFRSAPQRRYFKTTRTVIVNREEITEEEFNELHPLPTEFV